MHKESKLAECLQVVHTDIGRVSHSIRQAERMGCAADENYLENLKVLLLDLVERLDAMRER